MSYTNDHKHIVDKIFKIPYAIVDPIKYSKYKTQNNFILSGIELGFVGSILCGIVYTHRTINYGRSSFIGIYSSHTV